MVDREVANLKEEMIRLRRDFHRHPELAFNEKRTAGIVAKYLKDLGLKVQKGIGGTGVVGLLSGKGRGKTLLLRADMDALPIHEQNKVDYRSINDGVMHACGHDGHMAILLTVAKILTAHREDFSGRIKFVFQPGEEGFAGAKRMIDDGVLKAPNVDAALGLHLFNQVPFGVIGVCSGSFMASMDSFKIKITGKGGHAAMPEGGVDAILISAQVISSLQSLVSREISPMEPLVVHVGTIHGGNAFNIVADQVELKGTVRTLNEELRNSIPKRLERILKGVTEALKGIYELNYKFGYPQVINDEKIAKLVHGIASKIVGKDKAIKILPTMTSDDMAFFLKEVPGCYFIVGAGDREKGLNHPHHSALFDFEEDAMLLGAEMMIRVALAYLLDT